jgi:tetratricopeptide (TPR) repeat protein
MTIGWLYKMQGEAEKAKDAFVQSVAISEMLTREFPGEGRYWKRLGHNRFYLAEHLASAGCKPQAPEEFRKMMDAFEKAVRVAPDNADLLEVLAWHLAIREEVPTLRAPARAVVFARRAVELAPDLAKAWQTLGMACYYAGSCREAVTALERFLAIWPDAVRPDNRTVTVWFFLAMACSRLGEDQKARSLYDKAAASMDKSRPKDPELLRFRAEAAQVLGIKERAATKGKKEEAQKK